MLYIMKGTLVQTLGAYFVQALTLDLRNLSCFCLFIVWSGVSEALIFAFCNLSALLHFIACNTLSGCALRSDGKP